MIGVLLVFQFLIPCFPLLLLHLGLLLVGVSAMCFLLLVLCMSFAFGKAGNSKICGKYHHPSKFIASKGDGAYIHDKGSQAYCHPFLDFRTLSVNQVTKLISISVMAIDWEK
jgi:hypothetical protein